MMAKLVSWASASMSSVHEGNLRGDVVAVLLGVRGEGVGRGGGGRLPSGPSGGEGAAFARPARTPLADRRTAWTWRATGVGRGGGGWQDQAGISSIKNQVKFGLPIAFLRVH